MHIWYVRTGRWVGNLWDTTFLGDPSSVAEISLQQVITRETDTGQTGLRYTIKKREGRETWDCGRKKPTFCHMVNSACTVTSELYL